MPTSKISWASAPGQTPEALNFLTWNCHKVSPGCKHCYAAAHSEQYPQNSAGGQFLGKPQLRPQAFDELRRTKAGTVIFVNTHSDTFHESIPLEWLKRMFTHMNQRTDLIFLLLTKRPQVALQQSPYLLWTNNIWLGVSVENMDYYGRLVTLRQVPAKHRFVSFEPLLAAIDPAKGGMMQGIEWMIAGGESGEYRRPFGRQWAVDLQQFAAIEHIPFYFKQGSSIYPDQDRILNGQTFNERPAAFAELHAQYRVDADQLRLF